MKIVNYRKLCYNTPMEIEGIRETAENEYLRWLANTVDDKTIHDELILLRQNPEEMEDSFYTHLSFGTSGMRGLIGPGTNRINSYVIKRATQGLANYLNKEYKKPSVVIACDSRRGSSLYARQTAAVLKGNGITAYLFDRIAPVSLLSYAIGYLGCDMGVMITASHNPNRYNGYKVYNQEGYQIVGDEPDKILYEIEKLDYFKGIKYREEGIKTVDFQVSESFVEKIASFSTGLDKDILNGLKVVYTPLNGAGCRYVKDVLKKIGMENYQIVKVQEEPDENFTTCPVPNPERILAYDEAFKVLDTSKSDIIIATDPDSDRIGAAINHDGMRTLLSGNQLGILILDYICHLKPPKPGQLVIKSIVTSPLIEKMAVKYGFKVINTLTGFKYIGEIVSELRKRNRLDEYYYGMEESNGYLISPFICDKDGVSGSLITVEMAAFHKSQGKDLIERLDEIYEEFGVCIDKTRNYFFNGAAGKAKMDEIMDFFRSSVNDSIGGLTITKKIDYMGETGLPKSNVIELDLENGSRLIIRPSGTESKLKIYSFETGDFSNVENDIVGIIEKYKAL